MIEMKKSYRNTWEIARYAQTLVQNGTQELLERHGKEVEKCIVQEKQEAILHVVKQLHLSEGEVETAACLTLTEADAWEIYKGIKEMGIEVSYIDRDSSKFSKGLIVTTFYLAKGLEFDQVFSIMPVGQRGMVRQAKYICATRALHELYMYEYAK